MYRKAKPRIGDVIRANESAPRRFRGRDLTVISFDFCRYPNGEPEVEYMVWATDWTDRDGEQLFESEVDYAPSRG